MTGPLHTAVITPGDVPTLRVRTDDGAIEVHCDANEWAGLREADDFASWLAPMVDIFAEHDAIARKRGVAELTPERMAAELAETARTLLAPGYLEREGARWRFRGGRPPADPPKRDWGGAS